MKESCMRYLLIFLMLAVMNLSGGQLVREYPGIGVEEHRLENGLKVLIKKNDLDQGEVFIRIYSKGGYAQEKTMQEKVSAYVSFLALFESGFGFATSPEQVSKVLYDNSTELSLYVLPSSKGIEARIPVHHFDQLVEFMCGAFNHPKINQAGFSHVIKCINENREELSKKNKYHFLTKMYQIRFNGCHFSSGMPGGVIAEANLPSAQKYLEKAFGGDDSFTIVVVGDIESEKVIEALEKHLPKRDYKEKVFAGVPEMTVSNEPRIFKMKRHESKAPVSSIVYTVRLHPDGKELALFENTLRIIERRLDNKLSSMVGRKGFRVSFEFPCYPEVSLSWVQIKFNVSSQLKQSVLTAIHSQMTDLVENGPTEDEYKQMVGSLNRDGVHLQNDNYFWLSVISDYALWDWDLNQVALRVASDPSVTPRSIQEFLKKSLALNSPVSIFLE